MSAFRKKMEVIRHDAIRMAEKRVFRGTFEEDLHDLAGERCRRQVLRATVAAYCDEVRLAAEIIFGGQAGIFSMEGHGREER